MHLKMKKPTFENRKINNISFKYADYVAEYINYKK